MAEVQRVARWMWRWGHRGTSAVSFAEAVPLRRDRRELRRGLRAVVRKDQAEQKQQVTAGLGRLADRRVPVVAVRCAPDGEEVVEFADGTRLAVEVREGEMAWQRLVQQRSWGPPYIGRVEPCFGHRWFRLHFYVLGAERCAVMVRVDDMGPTVDCPPPRQRPDEGEPTGQPPP